MGQKFWSYRLFQCGFAAFFIMLTGISLLCHDNPYLPMGLLQMVIVGMAAAVVCAVGVMVWKRFGRAPRNEKQALTIALGVYFVVQCTAGLLMEVGDQHAWDYSVVCTTARRLVQEGIQPGQYYTWFPNNAPLMWLYVGFFTVLDLFGVRHFMPALTVLNCVCINASLLMLYYLARRFWGVKWAFGMLLGSFLCVPFLLYGPIAYTDTVSMPFVCGAALLWIAARDRYAGADKRKAAVFAWTAFFVAALGAVLKFSVTILVIAFVLDCLFYWRGKGKAVLLAAALVCFLLVWCGGNAASKAVLPDYDADQSIPYTHWIMMGLHEKGGYYDPDYQATLEAENYDERLAFHLREIKHRLQQMGPAGVARHCVQKLAYIISDGTYYAPEKLNRAPVRPSPLYQFVLPQQRWSGILYYAADGFQLCLLAACAVGSLRAARHEKYGITVFRVAVFGLLLFLLLWEARSRYLVNFLPLILLCGADGFLPVQAED